VTGSPAAGRARADDTTTGTTPTPDGDYVSVCRICQPRCGLIVSVKNGQVEKIAGDPQAASRGHLCIKGASFGQIQHDPDRVRYPLKRVGGPGEFRRCTWDEALSDIAARLAGLIKEHGRESVGFYFGNPTSYDTGHLLWLMAFARRLGTPHLYGAASQDTNPRNVASYLLYGGAGAVPFPDIRRTDFILIVGANPVISHGSMWGVDRIRDELSAVVSRGGRIVVVDPRRTETARLFEYVPIRADTDAWLLLGMLHVIFKESLADEAFIAAHTAGADELRTLVSEFSPDRVERETGIDAGRIASLARDFATAGSASAYGRTGACTTSFGTLVCYLLDCLNIITGNLDQPGGSVFPSMPLNRRLMGKFMLPGSYGARRSRIGDYPDVISTMPSAVMPREILTPGAGQLKALIVGAGNPANSTPDERAVVDALQRLDLLVCIDLYVSDTGRYADYVLPDQTFLERDDLDVVHMSYNTTPVFHASKGVFRPPPEARRACDIYDDIARRLGLVCVFDSGWVRLLARLGIRLTPRRLVDVLVRCGPIGDRFGLQPSGLNLRKIERKVHGLAIAQHPATNDLGKHVSHRDGRVRLHSPAIAAEVRRLTDRKPDPRFPLRLIGMRENRSHNSWAHNAPRLVNGRSGPMLRISEADAVQLGIENGEEVSVTSRTGSIRVRAMVSDEMIAGTVALPHGWGHRGGWRLANAAGGANANILSSCLDEDVEQISGTTRLHGIPVRVALAER
jgi:formate dehydrogenase